MVTLDHLAKARQNCKPREGVYLTQIWHWVQGDHSAVAFAFLAAREGRMNKLSNGQCKQFSLNFGPIFDSVYQRVHRPAANRTFETSLLI